MDALDGVPLQFGYTVADTYDGCSHFADAKEIGETGHETFVDGGHQLEDVARMESGAFERFLLVVS